MGFATFVPTDAQVTFALLLVALILSVIELVRSKGGSLLAWATGAIALGLTWGRF